MMMTIREMAFGVMLLSAAGTFAQTEVIVNDTLRGKTEKIEVPPSMEADLDSNSLNPLEKENLQKNPDCDTTAANPVFPPEVYKQRLMQIPSAVELPYNDIVQKFIDRYTSDLRNSVSYMLGAANFYMPIFEQALETEGVPLDLRFLPVIESALNPTAVSRVGAKGLWQFMVATARKYGLTVNSLVDERCDPVKASYAAAAYLKHLYATYGDWTLAIAAYNCGERQVDKAIRRSKGAKDYWAIYNRLPEETRGYVPAFIAANYIMNFYCEHNICPMKAKLPSETDTLTITRNLNLQQVAAMFSVDVERLRALNPQYRTDLVPGNSLPCTLRLPVELVDKFIDAGDSIYTYEVSGYKPRRTEVQPGGRSKATAPAKVQKTDAQLKENKPAATRKDEENTGNSIEEALRKTSAGNVEEADVKEPRTSAKRKATGGKTSKSSSGTSKASASRTDKEKKTDEQSSTTSKRRASSRKQSTARTSYKKSSSKTAKKITSRKKKETTQTHTVKSGDTLSELAEKYNTTVSKLKKMNNIKGNTIQSGKKIRVK